MSLAPPISARPRRRRLRHATLIVLGVIAGLGVGYWYLVLSEEREFQAAAAETDALDPGWRYADIEAARPRIPDDQNSALVLLKVHGLFVGKADGGTLQLQLSKVPANVRLTESQAAELRKFVEDDAAARAEGRRLKDLPSGRLPGMFDPKTKRYIGDVEMSQGFEVARFLTLDTLLVIHDGDRATLADSLRTIFNAARSYGDEPSESGQFFCWSKLDFFLAVLHRALTQCTPNATELQHLQELVEREIEEPRLLWGTRGQRAFVIEIHEAMRDGRVAPDPMIGGWRGLLPGRWLGRRKPDLGRYLRAMKDVVDVSRLPVEQQLAAATKLVNARKFADAETVSETAEFHQTCTVFTQIQANLRCALMALATERYRQEKGSWPESADALVKAGYLKQVPLDPDDGQPLRYRRLADGVEFGFGTAPAGATIPLAVRSFRLWDPETRPRPGGTP